MDVRLSTEQRALRDAAVGLVDKLGPNAVGQIGDADRVARLDAALAAAGWRELRVAADESGTPLASGVEVAVVAEELSRRTADVAFLGPTLAADLRRLAGLEAGGPLETVVLAATRPAPAGFWPLNSASTSLMPGPRSLTTMRSATASGCSSR